MKKYVRQLAALVMIFTLLFLLSPVPGRASTAGIYFTAANDQLMDLSADTMPFYSNGVLYVSSRVFEGGELGLSYGRNVNLGLATLYMQGSNMDLRFDLAGQTAYDKQYNVYNGYAIEKGGIIFFPLDLVCRYFGLSWSYNDTDTLPLIRVKSDSVILSDARFINAAKTLMQNRYDEFFRDQSSHPGNSGTSGNPSAPETVTPPEPPVQAAEGQKIYLIFNGKDARNILPALGDAKATFLLTLDELSDGDLVRSLVAQDYAVALRLQAVTQEEAEMELMAGREALWESACCWLELVWFDDELTLDPLLEQQGFVRVYAQFDCSALSTADLLRSIGLLRDDVAVFWGDDTRLEDLRKTLDTLTEAQFLLSGWRLSALMG